MKQAEEALKNQPIAPTPRKGAVTHKIHQALWRSSQTLDCPFPSPHVLCSVSFCFSQKLWEVAVRIFPRSEAEE